MNQYLDRQVFRSGINLIDLVIGERKKQRNIHLCFILTTVTCILIIYIIRMQDKFTV